MSIETFMKNFVPTTRSGRKEKFVLSEIMPEIKTEIVIMPISEGINDKRKGKISIGTVYGLVRDTGIFILFGTEPKTGLKQLALVAKIPKELKHLSWRLINSKK